MGRALGVAAENFEQEYQLGAKEPGELAEACWSLEQTEEVWGRYWQDEEAQLCFGPPVRDVLSFEEQVHLQLRKAVLVYPRHHRLAATEAY